MIELEEEEKKEEEKSFIERGGIAGYLNRNYQDKTIGKEITPAVQGTLGLLSSAVSDTMYKARRGMLGPHSFVFAHAVDFAGKIIPDAPIDRGISHGLHNWAGIDQPLADVGGELGEAYLTRKAFKFISNPKNLGITTSIEPYTKGLPSSKVKPIVNQNLTNKVTPNVTGVTNKATLPKYSSGAVVQTSEGTFYRPTEQLASIFQMDADASLLKDAVAPVTKPKHYIERENEVIHINERNIKLQKLEKLEESKGKKFPNERRAIMAEVGSHVKKWFNTSPKIKELKQPFIEHYKKRSNLKTKLASDIKAIIGVPKTNTGHIVSLAGAPDWKKEALTPYTAMDVSGSDVTKYIEEARSNRRHAEFNLFLRTVLSQIDRPSNQMEEAVYFVNNRPDLQEWTMADEVAESIKMNRLALGLETSDSIELREMLEVDLKKAGLFKQESDVAVLKKLLDKFYAEDLVKSATDETTGKAPWDVTKKGRLTAIEQRDQKFKIKKNEVTKLPRVN